MAQPPFVPQKPQVEPRFYESPERTRGAWQLDRPGDALAPAPTSGNFQGPDQGYALLLAERFRDSLALPGGDGSGTTGAISADNALTGCVAVALKRASLLGRAPVALDIELALLIWGFSSSGQGGDAFPQIVAGLRHSLFGDLEHNKHASLRIVELCDEDILVKPAAEIRELLKANPLAAFDDAALARS